MRHLTLLVLILSLSSRGSAQETYAEGITGPWNDGYKCQISQRDAEFAAAYKYKRERDRFAPECFFPPSLNWTDDEQRLYATLSKRYSQPCFDAFTKRMLDHGHCWLSLHPDPKINRVAGLKSTHDWTLVTEPEGLSPKWSGVFWSLVQKQYRKSWMRFQHSTYLLDKEEEDAAKDVVRFVNEPTATKVSQEDVVDRRHPDRQKGIEDRVAVHAKVIEFFENKPFHPGRSLHEQPLTRR